MSKILESAFDRWKGNIHDWKRSNEWTRRKITRIIIKTGGSFSSVEIFGTLSSREMNGVEGGKNYLIRIYRGGDERSRRNLYFNRSIEKPLSVQRQTRIYFTVYTTHLAHLWRRKEGRWGREGGKNKTGDPSDSYILVDETCGGPRRKTHSVNRVNHSISV